MTSKVIYKGDLRTESTHLQSGSVIVTDAPKDNHGKGEAFSPTDMVANSLATCMFSIMGIKAKQMDLDISESTADVTKIMQAEPRKISEIIVAIEMVGVADDKSRTILERAAMTCPVFLSLHPDIKKTVTFNWK
ncbi:OsmC family protein [Flavobacterium sp. xlx-214]|uniref:OsmC family protein n=1 Tax=unclassified Flavobacterium TaxID=196869 RepID=UPI0013D08F8C|nr:OsmC family protein [Flavobacterium sp. xlx-214]MBA5793083.1 OsmC family protein [Flavobacterium sp. xlx-221]QMI84962.1 OsmC family protein [Flavobacterium sp. xlx-214]